MNKSTPAKMAANLKRGYSCIFFHCKSKTLNTGVAFNNAYDNGKGIVTFPKQISVTRFT